MENDAVREFIIAYLDKVVRCKSIWSKSIGQYTANLILGMITEYDKSLEKYISNDENDAIYAFNNAMEIEDMPFKIDQIEFRSLHRYGYILMRKDDEFNFDEINNYHKVMRYSIYKEGIEIKK